eukprot:gnl/Trimastix_PCT/734.p2 GENE.gnl/Trimastix_PCT/734~~gnl/Trimastix_PCT/734.p2  ORF type:complete len:245 (-),score=104.88 gnl/Trimastix_PCT/734:51-785(-)
MEVVRAVDHTLLKAFAVRADIIKLCEEAKQHRFASVCVNGCWVATAKEALKDCPEVKVAAVVGFPLGAMTPEAKAFETKQLIDQGCDEIDMVLNVGKLINEEHDDVLQDIQAVVHAARPKIVKVILETCYLNDAQITKACELSCEAGAHFVKTSTGFGTGGATVEHVALMKSVVAPRGLLVKASGGIRSLADGRAMMEAGADRLGCSAGVRIAQEVAGGATAGQKREHEPEGDAGSKAAKADDY